jgi:hypothetical protein
MSALVKAISEGKDTRPDRYTDASCPEEFRAKKSVRIMASGNGFILTDFQIKGSMVPVPVCKVITFREDKGRGTQRFGDAKDLVYRSYYDTVDQRLIDLFMKDDRMGGFFWIPENGVNMTEAEHLASITARIQHAMDTMNYEEVRAQYVGLGRPLGPSLQEMRTIVSHHLAKAELEDMKRRGLVVANPEQMKEQLMK